MKAHGTSFIAGIIFALGLGLSGMTRPIKVIGFLDFFGNWDPSLACVMIAAIGVFFVAYRISQKLSSPLLAGVIADADQAAGTPLGFLNPILYKAYRATPTAFNDIVRPASFHSAAVIRVDYANEVNSRGGFVVSMRAINYQGPETYCDATGHCMTGSVTLTTRPGFDSMTGLGSAGASFIPTLAKY